MWYLSTCTPFGYMYAYALKELRIQGGSISLAIEFTTKPVRLLECDIDTLGSVTILQKRRTLPIAQSQPTVGIDTYSLNQNASGFVTIPPEKPGVRLEERIRPSWHSDVDSNKPTFPRYVRADRAPALVSRRESC